MAYDARAVANLLLDLADELGLSLTHMAIHKIAYFAHGWRLAQRGEPLVRQQFEAWDYGPVLRSIYDAFKAAGRAKIATRAQGFDPVARVSFPVQANFPAEDREFLRAILLAYGRYSATHLSDLTHRRGGAWDRVWNAPDGRVTLGMRIPDQAIRDDFLAGHMNPAEFREEGVRAASRH
jgi:uncharacterized phage-associated protein